MLPEAFLQRMQGQLGSEYSEFLASYEQPRHQSLRINTLKKAESGKSMEQVLTALFRMEKVPWAENGFYYDGASQPGKHPYHEAGLYYIQEPSAMAPAGFLDVCPGDRVLDLCAAPGGKSTQIGAMLRGEGLLISNEIHPARAKILSENIERMGIANACVTNESPEHLAEVFPEFFDRILVDAPCSGEGMFRKNEIALTEWSEENVRLCGERQDGILDQAAKMLRPGGRLVYSTCTFAEWENEGSIGRFLERHPEFSLAEGLQFRITASEGEEGCISFPGMLRLYPHKIRGEGHFLAVLRKAGEVPEGYRGYALTGMAKPVPEKECREWTEFCRENLKQPVEQSVYGNRQKGQYLRFGDNLYLVPEGFPELKGLKVLRPGLHLGECRKNRFEPSHALALALGPKDVRHVFSMHTSEYLPAAYLNGQTFPAEGEKGWYLICVDGISLGWGKLAGGIMKNHYPKGLRKA
ncbi:MAG: RsmB/NOP family class I SAM-dependent RNA methyltransferase [Lachnospiraceae bacterium]|nr:RsmB/NOP family class I SAM-dependent RNA methyltransferase [Lachnospiraceae bacterium]